jgi:NAD(P)-dependent dehydrogenase (short-subunit alcohol dehydrogenase family)
MPSVLITGANRGLGLEFVKQYSEEGWRVYACCRNPGKAAELNGLPAASNGGVSLHELDVSDPAAIAGLAGELRSEPLDILLNNAGIYGDESHDDFGEIDYDKWTETFAINVMGAMRMVEAFVENVQAGERKILAFVSSLMGSIADNGSGGSYMYRSSKAALNAVAKSLSIDLKKSGLTTVILHPGWVLTDMGGEKAPLHSPESVEGMRKVLQELRSEDSGRFLSYEGKELPW